MLRATLGRIAAIAVIAGCLLAPQSIFAQPTTAEQARAVVQNWLALDRQPLDAAMGSGIGEVETYYDEAAEPLYHIVYMEPQGFVVVAGDDLVEPIVAFVPEGIEYVASLDNPLGALVSQDMAGRIELARTVELLGSSAVSAAQQSVQSQAQQKWQRLQGEDFLSSFDLGISSISDVRVAPLVATRWNQQRESGGNLCYNLYTPSNYPCGCVATAMAQVMKFWQFPTTSVGTGSYTIAVNGSSQTRSLLGGDGSGGAYNWALMDNGPSVSQLSHRQAIGRLTHDAGLTVNMSYTSSGSGSDTLTIADKLKNPYGYSNAVKGYNSGSNIAASTRNTMTNPNLDAGYPVIFGITGSSGGHAIVGDGYGYNASTMYHHLNMGWGGYQDAWYNLPNINSSISFTSVYKVVYNIYTSGSGEIISGRVVDSNGNPLSGVTVTANSSLGGLYSDVTDSRGIYALAKIPSALSYTVSAYKSGYSFTAQSTSTLTSTNYSTVGNRWGINFTEGGGGGATTNFPWPLFNAVLQAAQNSSPVAGRWVRDFDWFCDGTIGTTVDTINSNNTWNNEEGYEGTWTLDGLKFTYIYPSGTKYYGTLNSAYTTMSGTMRDYYGNTGCWWANRYSPDYLRDQSGQEESAPRETAKSGRAAVK